MVLGTAAYLSPEQALGQPATAASDRYSLAVVAYELLTGRRPFGGEHPAAQARAHIETPPPRPSEAAPDLTAAVDRVLWRGLDKEPEHRWPTASAMVDALEDALGDRAEPLATAPTAAVRAPAPLRRRRRPWVPVLIAAAIVGLLAGAAIAALIGTGGGGGSTRSRTSPSHRGAPAPKHRSTAAAPRPATRSTPTTSAPPAAATTDKSALEAQGHSLIQAQRYDEAIPILQRAVADCPVTTTDPCAFAIFDLGHALRLAGHPADAIPLLQQRLQNPNQRGIVQAELAAAQAALGGGAGGDGGGGPGKPGKGPKKDKPHGGGGGGD